MAKDIRVQSALVTDFGAGEDSATYTWATLGWTAPTIGSAFLLPPSLIYAGDAAGTAGQFPPDDLNIRAEVTSTGILLTRETAGVNVDQRVVLTLVEYVGGAGGANEFIVRGRGTISITATNASNTATLTGVVSSGDVVLVSGLATTTASVDGTQDRGICRLSHSGSTVTATRGDTADSCEVAYQGVEFTGSNWTVEQITHAIVAAGSDETETLTVATGAWAEKCAFSTLETDDGGLDDTGWNVWPGATDSVLRFRVRSGGTAGGTITAYVLHHGSASVQHLDSITGTGTDFPVGTDAAQTVNTTVTAVTDLGTAFSLLTADCAGTGDAHPRVGWMGRLTTTTNHESWRSRGGQVGDWAIQVVDWDGVETIGGGGSTYTDVIANLGAQHHWPFDGDVLDVIGSADGTNTGGILTDGAITEDATNCYTTNGTGDRVSIPTTTDINNSAQARKAVCGWIELTGIQPPPKRIYGEGDNATVFQFMCAYGNNLMLEAAEPTNFTLQVFGPPLQPDRVYHVCGVFSGNGFDNLLTLYVDGVLQTLAEPTDRQPDTADLNARGVGEFGDPAGTVGVGGDVVILNAPVNGRYAHWATFDGVEAELTATEVREELFEKGALPDATIATDTEANMQTSLDVLADTVRPDAPLCIRIEDVSGGGDLELTADNITFNTRASIHVQWMGAGTLTWINDNGSDASIVSTPEGGTVVLQRPVTVTVDAIDNETLASIADTGRVRMTAAAGGPLTEGDVILEGDTSSGSLSGTFQYTADQPVTGWVRRATGSPRYKEGVISGTITENGIVVTVPMVSDE